MAYRPLSVEEEAVLDKRIDSHYISTSSKAKRVRKVSFSHSMLRNMPLFNQKYHTTLLAKMSVVHVSTRQKWGPFN